jgi:hypothetical protein
MTVKELREEMKDYSDDQFVHMRIWIITTHGYELYNLDSVVDKIQQGVDGAMLITGKSTGK